MGRTLATGPVPVRVRRDRPAPSERPTFLFVTQYFPPERGAAQVRLGALVDELNRRGHRVEVVTAVPNYPTGRIFPGWSRQPVQAATEQGVRTVRVWVWAAMGSGFGRLLNFVSFGLMSLVGLAGTAPADWTFVEYPTLPGALPAVVWCRLRRRPVVVNVADLWVDAAVAVGALPAGPVARAASALERYMLRQADAVNAVTDGVRHALEAKGVDPERICWLPNGADTELFRPGPAPADDPGSLGVPRGGHLFVYAGTQGYVHGLEVVLDAAAILAADPVCFLLVGGGSEHDRLVAETRRRGLANVVFHDPVSPERVAELLRSATAGLASVRAGELYRSIRSAKMLPVMATAQPVIYAGADEGAALVERLGAGLTVPPGDGAALADAVRSLLADPQAAADMGRRGREYVEAEASWTAITGRWLADLEQVDPR